MKTTAYFLMAAVLSLGALAIFGLGELRNLHQDNSNVRIDRAGRAASALFAERIEDAASQLSSDGSPAAIIIGSRSALAPDDSWNVLLDEIGGLNQGAANLFRVNDQTGSFDRFSTTFRTPEGDRVGGDSVAPGLIAPGHPAFEAVTAGERFVGEVPVAGRLRLAYLTPILDELGQVAGILAVDVGWVDDLERLTTEARIRGTVAALLVLAVLAVVCAALMICSFRPLRRLTEIAHALGSSDAEQPIELTDRRDEIGSLARGLAKVADLQRSLAERAYSDPLTSIANRGALLRELEQRFQDVGNGAAHGGALVVIDLDGFKEVNDGLGHQVGDELLVFVAAALADAVGPTDFLARLGGDEFAVLLGVDCVDEDMALQRARRAVEAVAQTFKTSAGEVQVSASAGIALLPEHGTTTEEVVSHADLALYDVKHTGPGGVRLYELDMSGRFQRRLHLGAELRRVLESGHLRLAYQPIYRSDNGQIHSLEALARWHHPHEGPISPAEFIPIAENLGLIEKLGSYVLDEACRQARVWSQAHKVVPVMAVNVSTIQMRNPSFVSHVRETLARHQVAPAQLCLELTESALVPQGDGIYRAVLEELSDMGIRLAIDDFGTGYSSLSYLHELVVDEIKIDRTFVAGVTEDPNQAQLLAGVIGLGKTLELTVVLEGVETEEEFELARTHNCDLVQGYLLGKPLMPDQVERRFGHAHPQISVLSTVG